MSVKVRIPTPLQKLTANQAEVQLEAATIDEMLAGLEKRHPGIKERLCDAEGKLRRFVNVYVNEEDIRFLQGQETALKSGDDISIIPAIAGGAETPEARRSSSGGLETRRVTLVFPQDRVKEPVVFTMAKQYNLMPNIRRARVTETAGEMTLEIQGKSGDLDKGIAYLESRGVKVEPVTGDSAR